jgi:hypothetical protein
MESRTHIRVKMNKIGNEVLKQNASLRFKEAFNSAKFC